MQCAGGVHPQRTLWLLAVCLALWASLSAASGPCKRESNFSTRGGDGLSIEVDSCGGYSVSLNRAEWLSGPRGLSAFSGGAWYSASRPSADPKRFEGKDSLGSYSALSFEWDLGAAGSASTSIRVYGELSAVVFSQSFPEGLNASSLGNPNLVASPYPQFDWERTDLRYATYNYSFARPLIGDLTGIPPLTGILGGIPLVLYDADAWALVLSPFRNFMTGIHALHQGRYACGINGLVRSYPPGFTHETLLFGGRGVVRSIYGWGDLLLRRTGKERRREDVITSHALYWTGSGSFYKYLAEPGRTYQESLEDAYRYAHSIGVKLHGIQLDSVWYPKGPQDLNPDGSVKHGNFSVGSQQGQTHLWEPYSPEVFQDMERFSERIYRGRLVLHSRMISSTSPYCKPPPQGLGFRCFESISRKEYLPAEDAFWNHIWKEPLKWGMDTFLMDWLKETFFMPDLMTDLYPFEIWLDGMNRAAQRYDISLMFSEPGPSHLLKSTEMDMVNTARGSGDYQPGRTNYYMAYTGILEHALGLIPFKQTFWSSGDEEPECKEDYDVCREPNPEINALVAALSAGTFTPSDKVGYLNATRLLRGLRKDGRILKPDGPLVPFDWAYIDSPASPDERPGGVFQENFTQVWYTHTSWGEPGEEDRLQWYYLLALNTTKPYSLSTEDLVELEVPYTPREQRRLRDREFWAYDHYDPSRALSRFDREHPIALPRLNNGSNTNRFDPLPFKQLVLCPALSNGWVLLGETSKFVPISKQRLQRVTPVRRGLSLEIVGSPGESVTMEMAARPQDPHHSASCIVSDSGRVEMICTAEMQHPSQVSCLCR